MGGQSYCTNTPCGEDFRHTDLMFSIIYGYVSLRIVKVGLTEDAHIGATLHNQPLIDKTDFRRYDGITKKSLWIFGAAKFFSVARTRQR